MNNPPLGINFILRVGLCEQTMFMSWTGSASGHDKGYRINQKHLPGLPMLPQRKYTGNGTISNGQTWQLQKRLDDALDVNAQSV